MLFFRKKIFYIDLVVILFCGFVAFYFFYFAENKKHDISENINTVPIQTTEKVWQVAFTFHPQNQTLTVQSVTVKPGKATVSPLTNSQYTLQILDKNQHILFKTGIPIADQVLYDIYFPPGATPSGLLQPDHLDSLITIPYFADAQTMRVMKNNQKILEFNPTKEVSFHLPDMVKSAFAAANCDLLHIIFVSDGYTNMATFHSDVQRAEATFISKQPFAAHSSIFDFKTVDNPASNSLGCEQNGSLQVNCLYTNSNLSAISNVVFTAYPQLPQDPTYTKIVVLVDGNAQPMGGGYILGVANALGGQFGVFQNKLFFESTATMEVLGHDVSQLYDRYLYPASSGASQFGNTIAAPYASNCSTNPRGEFFWKSAGVNQGYKGCTSEYLYAPAPLDCGAQGSHSTIMSAAGCAGTAFDGVEQYYIKSQILPRYCSPAAAIATPTSPAAGFSSSITPVLSSAVSRGIHSSPTSSTSAQSPQTSQKTATTVPTKIQTFNCQPDPNCQTSKTLGMCALKCTPN